LTAVLRHDSTLTEGEWLGEEVTIEDEEIELELVVPQPGIVKNDVSQLVCMARLPIISQLVQETALVMHNGRLLVGVGVLEEEDKVDVIPQPVDEKYSVAQ